MCERIQLDNGTQAIICGGQVQKVACHCGRVAKFLCDWKVPERHSGTCDRALCENHAKEVGRCKHLCPEHNQAWIAWQKRHPPAQASLFSEAS